MGCPRKFKNHYMSVKRPYDVERLKMERELKKKYCLKKKQEIRSMEYIWRMLRKRARKLIAEKDKNEIENLFKKIDDYGLCIGKELTLENILDLKLTDLFERRLQNIVVKLNLASTQAQARQYIVHRHIRVNDIIIFSPNYIVKKDEEDKIVLTLKTKKAIKNKDKKGDENSKNKSD